MKNDNLSKIKAISRAIIKRLKRIYPDAAIALHYKNPLELLVATILSAQCTDERVNIVTKNLFKKYKTAKDYADANQAEFEQEIRSTGFFKAKTRNIINCCKQLVEKHNGNVPNSMEELRKLPGVGRKTANVVLAGAFRKIEGIVVDTHVKRLAVRLGFSKDNNPWKIEQDMMQIIPKKDWIIISNLLIFHGRKICKARKPNCPDCKINDLCQFNEKFG